MNKHQNQTTLLPTDFNQKLDSAFASGLGDSGQHDVAESTLLELLQNRARLFGDQCAYRYLWEDGSQTEITYRELDRQARAVAASLQATMTPGDRALLVFAPGLEFMTAFLGCVYAGVVAVPATYPKPNRPAPRIASIAEDSGATVALTTRQTLHTLDRSRLTGPLQGIQWIAVDTASQQPPALWQPPKLEARDLAFLQYTSGSTSDPKGVMVTHQNLMHNLEMIRRGFRLQPAHKDNESGRGVFWLPPYHDMGLIGGILEPLYVGACSILMSPAAFLQRPERWLKAISDWDATVSGAPNFAYDLCVRRISDQRCQDLQLDLSHWRIAFCGAEPIHPETLRRFVKTFAPYGFREDAFYPCYGLAEATLLAAGGNGPAPPTFLRIRRSKLQQQNIAIASGAEHEDSQELVGCGQSLPGQELAVVHPSTRTVCPEGHVGEIWIRGANVASGYWNCPEASNKTFQAHLSTTGTHLSTTGTHLPTTGSGPFMRSGDLGFLYHNTLYVTGRQNDLLIIRGRNHHPHDIELTAQLAHPALSPSAGAAFSAELHGEESLVVVQEVDRAHRKADFDEVIRRIRREVTDEHSVEPQAIVLIRQASIPRTTSGKVQRGLCRQQFLQNKLKILAKWLRHPTPTGPQGGGATNSSTIDRLCWDPLPDELLEMAKSSRLEQQRFAERIETQLLQWLQQQCQVPETQLDANRPFAEFGVDSLAAMELSGTLEDWLSVKIPTIVAWQYPTPATLATYLAGVTSANGAEPKQQPEATEKTENAFGRLLAEIENMSEHEVEISLALNPDNQHVD